jgi:hypothetical protein
VIVLARKDVEVHLHVLQITTEQFQLCEWGHFSSWKTALLFRNNVWTMGCTRLPNVSIYSLAASQPCRLRMGPTEYRTTKLLPKASQKLPHVSLLDPGIPDCRLAWVFSKGKPS